MEQDKLEKKEKQAEKKAELARKKAEKEQKKADKKQNKIDKKIREEAKKDLAEIREEKAEALANVKKLSLVCKKANENVKFAANEKIAKQELKEKKAELAEAKKLLKAINKREAIALKDSGITAIRMKIIMLVIVLLAVIGVGYVGYQYIVVGVRAIKAEKVVDHVRLTRDGKKQKLQEGYNLKSDDHVRVGDGGFLEVLIDSDKHLVAEEGTEFDIIAKGKPDRGMVDIQLEKGSAFIEIENKLADDSTFEVNTPNATLSVRGTIFTVTYDDKTQVTYLSVEEGVVRVKSGDITEDVEAGENYQVGAGAEANNVISGVNSGDTEG